MTSFVTLYKEPPGLITYHSIELFHHEERWWAFIYDKHWKGNQLIHTIREPKRPITESSLQRIVYWAIDHERITPEQLNRLTEN